MKKILIVSLLSIVSRTAIADGMTPEVLAATAQDPAPSPASVQLPATAADVIPGAQFLSQASAQIPAGSGPAASTSSSAPAPAAPAAAAPAASSVYQLLKLGGKWSVGFSLSYDAYTVGVRDFYNGQWLAGWGKKLFPIQRDGVEVFYISGYNVYNYNEGGRGAIGAAIGGHPINFINCVAKTAGAASNVIPLPPWLNNISNWTSVEGGYAYRFFSQPQGVSRHAWTIGGQVRVPFDLAVHH